MLKIIIFLFLKFKKLFSGPIYLETFFENVNFKNVTTLTTVSNKANVGSIKIFAHNESQQAFILSGPEVDGR